MPLKSPKKNTYFHRIQWLLQLFFQGLSQLPGTALAARARLGAQALQLPVVLLP
jgi:hypothetical protein